MKLLLTFFFTALILFSCSSGEHKDAKITSKVILKNDSTLQTGWYYVISEGKGLRRHRSEDTTLYFLDSTPIVTAQNIVSFEIYEMEAGDYGMIIQLDEEGTAAWSVATRKSVGRKLGFVVDNKLLSVPIVNSEIPNGMTAFSGDYTKEEMLEIQKQIEN